MTQSLGGFARHATVYRFVSSRCDSRAQLDRVRALLADGADFNSTNEKGETPLMVAASVGSPEIVEVLLNAGANPTPKDKLGYTAGDLAYWRGEYRMGAYTPESLRIIEMLDGATSHDAD